MSERERFEEWADKQGWVIQRHLVSGRYTVSFIQRQWQAWQARADLAAKRERELVEAIYDLLLTDNEAAWRLLLGESRLKEIKAHLDKVGNPWPEAAYGLLRDPERLEEAEALLASARERARPFPEVPAGPDLPSLGPHFPHLVIRAAEQLVRTDQPEYSPLFVWSPDGMAARVILEATGRSLPGRREERLVAATSVSEFAQDFIHALSAGVAGAWRERWWSVDLLLVHGLQDLAGTERAQEEFFHLFEALQRRQARIMVAADRSPPEIAGIDDRLRSRFEGGLVLEVRLGSSDLPAELRPVPKTMAPAPAPAAPKLSRPAGAPKSSWREDVAARDREWIMSFGPGTLPGAGRADEGGILGEGWEGSGDRLGAAGERAAAEGAWYPSGEQVIWQWPRLRDRIVEDLD